ncbi:hypothetical protein [Dyadobacter crusticola]|uniref:hypothetical protein n=1 Tax=Dyadobacter crusticola TaxID=292407 RepID=UPI0004E120E3|nr:hypothetical protein [Dyadobacter crusticola]
MENSSTTSTNRKSGKPASGTFSFVDSLVSSGKQALGGKGLQMGVHTLIGRTALKRLPPPLNFVVPMVVERVILKHGVNEGREMLLKGLRWVKKVTDEPATKPV